MWKFGLGLFVITHPHLPKNKNNILLGMTTPKISIIIPSYNHAPYLKACIDSVLAQTYIAQGGSWELIIVDDCSEDSSWEIIEGYNGIEGIRIYRNEKNEGGVATHNKCIGLALGEYISILNSDDSWVSYKLEKQLLVGGDLVFTGTTQGHEFFAKENTDRMGWLNKMYFNANCLCHSSALVKREVYEKVGLYNDAYKQLPDYDMWVRALVAGYEVRLLTEPLVNYRLHPEQSTRVCMDNISCSILERVSILREFMKMNDEDMRVLFNYDEVVDRKYWPMLFYFNAPKDLSGELFKVMLGKEMV